MCGIVGYVGVKNASPILIEALKKLEYRGYDSAGIAVLNNDELLVRKAKGALKFLQEKIAKEIIRGSCGIGHTRWATHGEPSDENSHPHTDVSGSIAVVHNGIIENYSILKQKLQGKGITFKSETDTEVIAHLVHYYYDGNLLYAVAKALNQLQGSYALAVICKDSPDTIVCARKDSPLVIGQGNGEQFLASDVPALLEHTRTVFYLNDNELALIKKEGISFFNEELEPIEKTAEHVNWDLSAAEKDGFEHFMLKEIYEQPQSLLQTLRPRIVTGDDGLKSVNLDEIGIDQRYAQTPRVIITACGTAYHAGLAAKYAIEHFARIPVDVDIASEYRYRSPILNPADVFIIISQSGETADTLAAMRMAKKAGARIIAITNVAGSTLAREADAVLFTLAGPEIAVASTKAFTSQLMCVYLVALKFAQLKGTLTKEELHKYIEELEALPAKAQELLQNKEIIQRFAAKTFNKKKVFFMGRLADYPISMESALKLKEISYTHSESFAAGELKHGPIALVDTDTLVVAVCTQSKLFDKMDSNIKEVKARGATVMCITYQDESYFNNTADATVTIPRTYDELTPMLSVIPAQLFAYYCAVQRSLDPDKPRNLAKSVTVE